MISSNEYPAAEDCDEIYSPKNKICNQVIVTLVNGIIPKRILITLEIHRYIVIKVHEEIDHFTLIAMTIRKHRVVREIISLIAMRQLCPGA